MATGPRSSARRRATSSGCTGATSGGRRTSRPARADCWRQSRSRPSGTQSAYERDSPCARRGRFRRLVCGHGELGGRRRDPPAPSGPAASDVGGGCGARPGRRRPASALIHRFSVGRLSCTVVSDGQPGPPWEPPLDSFFTPGSGVPAAELAAAVAAEGADRTTLTGGYNCLLVETSAGLAVIDTGLGAGFLGYGPDIGRQVGRLGERLTEVAVSASDLAAVVFTHLHQDHVRGATWPGELAFPAATGHAHAAEIAFWSATAAELAAVAEH